MASSTTTKTPQAYTKGAMLPLYASPATPSVCQANRSSPAALVIEGQVLGVQVRNEDFRSPPSALTTTCDLSAAHTLGSRSLDHQSCGRAAGDAWQAWRMLI